MALPWTPIAQTYNPLKAGSIDGTDVDPHDRAVIRALKSRYKPNRSVDGDPLKTIFVARLNRDTEEDTLWTAFRTYGKIKKCRLVRDIVTGFSKGYGFIEYEDEKSARAASRRGNRMVVDKAEVFVDMECERTLPGWIPRRFGGGVGGNKKSGQLRFGGKDRPFIRPLIPTTTSGRSNQEEFGNSAKQDQGDWNSSNNRSDRSYNYDRGRNRGDHERDGRRPRDERRRGQDYRSQEDEYRSERRDRWYRDRSRSPERDRNRDKDRHRRKASPDYIPKVDVGSVNKTVVPDYQPVTCTETQMTISDDTLALDKEVAFKVSSVDTGADMEDGEYTENQ